MVSLSPFIWLGQVSLLYNVTLHKLAEYDLRFVSKGKPPLRNRNKYLNIPHPFFLSAKPKSTVPSLALAAAVSLS